MCEEKEMKLMRINSFQLINFKLKLQQCFSFKEDVQLLYFNRKIGGLKKLISLDFNKKNVFFVKLYLKKDLKFDY